jgi:hypothetical protein
VFSVELITAISPDLSTYSPLRAEAKPSLPMLIYVPMSEIFAAKLRIISETAKENGHENDLK